MSTSQSEDNPSGKPRHIPLSHNSTDSQASALRLILTIFPDWEHTEGDIEFNRFTDGITNTLLKAVKRRPGLTEQQIDSEAVLLRAYGKGTEILIDRERETTSHSLLAQHKLAPPLLARFQNGLLYRFIQGRVCKPEDLTREAIWRAVARRLGEWHAVLPIVSAGESVVVQDGSTGIPLSHSSSGSTPSLKEINAITPGKAAPNLWTVLQKWIFALPKDRQLVLQKELERSVKELGDVPGLGKDGLIFGHCDLLSGNVIIEPHSPNKPNAGSIETVSFIDYEYATPSPAAFDIANHFAEWGGFDCDHSVLPTRSQRRAFLHEYLSSYNHHLTSSSSSSISSQQKQDHHNSASIESEVDRLFAEVDLFRGIPGFYWGIWALIQAKISQIDFDYAAYAEVRLGEYWAWRAEVDGSREKEGREMPLRERRWGQEA
ncbi:hypothetical protein MMC24_002122 [Lignoscripta atroalba]|nr:hypothetical protein [Lignoscripta atroalba]